MKTFIAIAVLTAGLCYAQEIEPGTDRTKLARQGSELHIQLLLSRTGQSSVDERRLTIRLHNQRKTPLSLPEPQPFCVTDEGYVMVYTKAFHAEDIPATAGCAGDSFRLTPRDILAEAKKWKTIAPGRWYDVTLPLRSAANITSSGVFELRATYFPPRLTSTEVETLEKNNIHPVQQEAESTPIIVGTRTR